MPYISGKDILRGYKISKERYYPIRKKHSRKSISWHKRRILARLNPKVDKGQKIGIIQHTSPGSNNTKCSMLHLCITDRTTRVTGVALRRHPVQEHHRIVRALRYLVAEGKLEVDMTTKEWDIQLALGTANMRTFTLKEEK